MLAKKGGQMEHQLANGVLWEWEWEYWCYINIFLAFRSHCINHCFCRSVEDLDVSPSLRLKVVVVYFF